MQTDDILRKAKHSKNTAYLTLKYVTYIIFAIAILSLLSVIIFILARGLPHISLRFIFGKYDVLNKQYSVAPAIVGTLYLIFLTLLISVPIGVFAAIYLNEYTHKSGKIVKYINVAIDTLSGVPSIIFGLFGSIFFVNALNLKLSVWSGALTLTLINLPVIIRSTQEALLAVPSGYREGSYALGAGKLKTIFKVVLPSAYPGILTAVILSVGRIVGESAAVMFTAGSSPVNMPSGLSGPATNLASAVYYFSFDAELAAAAAVVLLFFVVGINLIANYLSQRLTRKYNRE
jgi:phosphate transport system permease protein